MKRFLFLTAAAMGLLFASCQKAELVDSSVAGSVESYTTVITAGVDETDTKVGFDEDGNFYWHESDKIAAQTIVESKTGLTYKTVSMSLIKDSSSEETETEPSYPGKMRFGASKITGEIGKYAFYPYASNVTIVDNILSFQMPSPTVVPISEEHPNLNTPMWAEIVDGDASFKHLGSYIKVIVKNVPTGTKVVLNADQQQIAGTFTCDLSDETPVISTSLIDSENEADALKKNETTATTKTSGTNIIYFPVPVGTYNRLEVSVASSKGNVNKVWYNTSISRRSPKKTELTFVSSEAQLQEAIKNSETVTLNVNYNLTSPIIIEKDVTIDLNGKSITAGTFNIQDGIAVYGTNNSWAFWVKSGSLTIIDSNKNTEKYFENNNGTGKVTAIGAENSHIAVVEAGATLNIKAGHYKNAANPANGNTAILIKNNNGTVNISGGYYEASYNYVNQQNKFKVIENATITGGEFFGFNPTVSGGYTAIGVKEDVNKTFNGTFGTSNYNIKENVITYKVVEEANVGTALVEAFAAGNDIKLTQNVTVSEPLVATGWGQSLDLNGKTINNTIDIWSEANDKWSLISVQSGSLTISGEGKLIAKENDCYAIDVRGGATLTIESGTYVGNISAVYVEKGKAQINGGEFSIQQTSNIGGQSGYGYVLNCLDANYAAKTAAITVKGGKFKNFDPKANPEGANTSYMAKDYTTNKDGYFWVAGYDPLVTESDLDKLFGPTTANGSISSLKLTDSFSKGDKTLTLDQSKKSALLDLNGMTLQVDAIVLNGSLTVNNGKLIANSITINDGGNLTLNNVTDFDYSKVTINSAKVKFETTAATQQELTDAIKCGASTVNLTEGNFEANLYDITDKETLTIKGNGETKIAFNNLQVRASQFKELKIQDCVIERMPNKSWGHVVFGSSDDAKGVYTIENCTFNGVGTTGIYINENVSGVTYNILNCTFDGDFGGEGAITVQCNQNVNHNVNIKGCTFSNIPTSSNKVFVIYQNTDTTVWNLDTDLPLADIKSVVRYW